MCPRYILRPVRIVHIHKYRIRVIIPEITVGIVTREEMHSPAIMNHLLTLPPVKEGRHITVKFTCLPDRHRQPVRIYSLGIPAFLSEQVAGITRPSSRKINTQTAMITYVTRIGRHEHKLVTRENLRYSAHGGHQGHCNLQPGRVLAHNVTDSGSVMIAREYQHL